MNVYLTTCPNHKMGEEFGKIVFVKNDVFKCDLCGKEFDRDEIKQLIVDDFESRKNDLSEDYRRQLLELQEERDYHLVRLDVYKQEKLRELYIITKRQ